MTVLRSADFDAHWQDIGTRAQMGKEKRTGHQSYR